MRLIIPLAFVVAAFAQPQPEPAAVLEGKVVNSATGEPVTKVVLTLRQADPPRPPQVRPAAFATMSGAGGRFSFSAIPAGRYRLGAQRNGFVDVEYGAKRAGASGVVLEVGAGQRLSALDLKLIQHGVIAGRIADVNGNPITRTEVSAIRYGYQLGGKQAVSVARTSTDDRGEYRLFGLAPGGYFVVARHSSTLSGGDSEDRSVEGGAAEGYVPTFYPGTGDVQAAAQVEVVAGTPMLGMNFQLAKARLVRVRGRLMNQSGATGRLSIMLLPKEPMGYPNILSPSLQANGQFEFRNLIPGEYSLSAGLQIEPGNYHAVNQPLVVGGEDMKDLVIPIRAGVDISGKIRAPESLKPSLGKLRVRASFRPGLGLTIGSLPSSAVDADGGFLLKNTHYGQHLLRVEGLPSNAYIKSIRSGERDALEELLEVTEGGGVLEITLGENPARLDGVVVNARSEPVAAATVVVIPESEKRRQWQHFYRTAVSGPDGRYSIGGVDPGSYRVYAWEDIENGAWMDLQVVEPVRSKGKVLKVGEGGSESLELTVIPAP